MVNTFAPPTAKTPAKLALCIYKADAPPFVRESELPICYAIQDGFFNTCVHLADRSFCEKDESLLQLLPYITLTHKDRVFVYARGGSGGESRLHGNLSIGLGGHVDIAPAPNRETLLQVLQREAAREYFEETGGSLRDPVRFDNLLYDPTNEVGRVHLGLSCRVHLHDDVQMELEEDVITEGVWVTLAELAQPEYFLRLENWSKMVFHSMTAE